MRKLEVVSARLATLEEANKFCVLYPIDVCRNSATTSRRQCLMKKILAAMRCLYVSAFVCLISSFKTSATLEGGRQEQISYGLVD